MAIIIEFEIDFRYDLRSPQFNIIGTSTKSVNITMPPCNYDVNIKNLTFYDEQKSKLLPFLLGDITAGITGGFSEEKKNMLVSEAKSLAESQAMTLIIDLRPQFQQSAQITLQFLARSFGIDKVDFDFVEGESSNMVISIADQHIAV